MCLGHSGCLVYNVYENNFWWKPGGSFVNILVHLVFSKVENSQGSSAGKLNTNIFETSEKKKQDLEDDLKNHFEDF